MYTVGIIGGIGSGKSTMSAYLAARGASILSADEVAREVRDRSDVALELEAEFGPGIRAADGSIDSGELAERAFSSPAATKALDAICLPRIERAMMKRIGEMRGERGMLVVEIPLYERGNELVSAMDELVCLTAPCSMRLVRLVGRGMSIEDAKRRMAIQDEREALADADTVIVNDEGAVELKEQVERWLGDGGRLNICHLDVLGEGSGDAQRA